jgi:hypothetical protein
MALPINSLQKRIYDKAVLATEYTVAELVVLDNDMPAVEDGYFHTPDSGGPASKHYGEIKGLVDAGYFTATPPTYVDVLLDWTFAKVASPPATWPTLVDVIPFPSGDTTPAGANN